MNKKEIYNAALEVRTMSGQGMSELMLQGQNIQACEDLVREGKFKKVRPIAFKTLPDDYFYCVNDGGYCIEEDFDNIHFLRYYLGMGKDKIINAPSFKHTNEDVVNAQKSEYDSWLEKNKESLKILLNPDKDIEIKDFSEDEIEWIKTRTWYLENKSIDTCIEDVGSVIKLNFEKINLLQQLVDLMNTDRVKYGEDYFKNKKELAETKNENILREKIIKKLRTINIIKDLI